MRCIRLIIICIFIFQCNCLSQENHLDFSTRDSISNVNPINKNNLQFKNFFRDDLKQRMGDNLLLGLYLYSKSLNDSLFFITSPTLDLKDYSKDELATFKESFSLLMELAKRDRNKYDLGAVTKYLGISQRVMAIILAILSIAK